MLGPDFVRSEGVGEKVEAEGEDEVEEEVEDEDPKVLDFGRI